MVTTVSDVCNVSNVQLHVLIKKKKRAALNLIMKARLSAKLLLRKLVFLHMQTKLILRMMYLISK